MHVKSAVNNQTRYALSTILMVVIAFVVVQILIRTGNISSLIKGQLVPICAYIVLAISLNLTVGILGELSLGHAGFMSVGTFTAATVCALTKASIPSSGVRLLLAIILGGIMAGIVGILIGIPVLRLKGDYLAIVTLAFGEIIKGIMNNLYLGFDENGVQISIVNDKLHLAPGGKVIIGGPMGLSGNEKLSTFIAGFILILFCLIVVFNFVDSRSGRAVMAVRDNDIAAESVGINTTKYRLMAFTISAVLAGMGGALFGMNFTSLAASKFDFNTSILILVFVVLGGLGNIRGSIIAATILTVLPEVLRAFRDYRMLLYAIVLILIMLATNSPAIRSFFGNAGSWIRNLLHRNGEKGEAANG